MAVPQVAVTVIRPLAARARWRKWRNCTFLQYAATVRDGVKCLAQRDKVMAIETVTSDIGFFVPPWEFSTSTLWITSKCLKNISLVENHVHCRQRDEVS